MANTSSPQHTAIAFPAQGKNLIEIQVDTPVVRPGTVLVRVLYSSPTPLDIWQGHHGLIVSHWPLIPSDALTGTVIAVSDDVSHLSVGDTVFSFTFGENEGRAAQEVALLSANRVGRIPPGLDAAAVATVPNNLVTAIHTLTHDLQLPLVLQPTDTPVHDALKNKRILIWGGGTSAGQYAVQVLAQSGYRNIIATASSYHHNYLREIGATHTVDYRSESWQKEIGEPVDLALDNVGDVEESLRKIGLVVRPAASSIVAALLPLRHGGKKVTNISFDLEDGVLPKEVNYIGVRTHFYEQNEHYKQHLQPKIIPELLASGKIKPNKTREITEGGSRLANYQKAIDLLAAGEVSGEKLVVKIT